MKWPDNKPTDAKYPSLLEGARSVPYIPQNCMTKTKECDNTKEVSLKSTFANATLSSKSSSNV